MATLLTPSVLEFEGIPHQAVADSFYVRTVITDKHDQQPIFTTALLQRPDLSVDTAQREIDGRRAEIANRCFQ